MALVLRAGRRALTSCHARPIPIPAKSSVSSLSSRRTVTASTQTTIRQLAASSTPSSSRDTQAPAPSASPSTAAAGMSVGGDWSIGVMRTISQSTPVMALETFSVYRTRLSTQHVLATLAHVSTRWNTFESPTGSLSTVEMESILASSQLVEEVVNRVTVTASSKPSAELLTGCIEYLAQFRLRNEHLRTMIPLLTLTQTFLDAAVEGLASDQKLFAISRRSPTDTLWSRLIGTSPKSDNKANIFKPDVGVRWQPDEMLSLMNGLLHIRPNSSDVDDIITQLTKQLLTLVEMSIEVKIENPKQWTATQLQRFFHVVPLPRKKGDYTKLMTIASAAMFHQLNHGVQTKYWSTSAIVSVMTALTRPVPYRDVYTPLVNGKIALQLSEWFVKRAFPRTATGSELLSAEQEHMAHWTPVMVITMLESLVALQSTSYRVMDLIAYELSAPEALIRWSLADVSRLAYAYGRIPSVTAAMINTDIMDHIEPPKDKSTPPTMLMTRDQHDANQIALMMAIGDRMVSAQSSFSHTPPRQLVQVLFAMAVHRTYHVDLFKACETFFVQRWADMTNSLDLHDKRLLHMVFASLSIDKPLGVSASWSQVISDECAQAMGHRHPRARSSIFLPLVTPSSPSSSLSSSASSSLWLPHVDHMEELPAKLDGLSLFALHDPSAPSDYKDASVTMKGDALPRVNLRVCYRKLTDTNNFTIPMYTKVNGRKVAVLHPWIYSWHMDRKRPIADGTLLGSESIRYRWLVANGWAIIQMSPSLWSRPSMLYQSLLRSLMRYPVWSMRFNIADIQTMYGGGASLPSEKLHVADGEIPGEQVTVMRDDTTGHMLTYVVDPVTGNKQRFSAVTRNPSAAGRRLIDGNKPNASYTP